MGVDCHSIHQVIHWGIPEDAEMYVQESGRAGRDSKPVRAILVKYPRDLNLKHVSQQMINTVQTNLNVGDQSSTVIFQTAVTSLLKAVCVVMYVPVLASVDNVIIT